MAMTSACGDDDPTGFGGAPTDTDDAMLAAVDPERCAANREAGTITYLSGFDFAAAASIVDVVVAEQSGYFDDLCLDVDVRAGASPLSNYPLVAAGEVQISSAGSYTEILNNTGDGAEFAAFIDYGKTPIEALITPDGGATDLADLDGATIGVKGAMPPSIVAMLADAGVRVGAYDEIVLDGYDPIAHLATGIDALPVYKSNEPGLLDSAGVRYTLFDPTDADIPGSFGLLYTSREFLDQHPSAVEDFARASLKAMADAIADPAAAVDMSLDLIDVTGNDSFLTQQGELFRWQQELAEILRGTPDREPIGLIDPQRLSSEYDFYVAAGVWPDGDAPANSEPYDADIAARLYDEYGRVIWPA
jgi:ABC-type nitrate/sulfonate/bicarbonate transport system substrate-binding protein